MKISPYIFFLFVLTACKKEKLPEVTESPTVFNFTGNINGTDISIDAGIDNYYMYSSVIEDQNGVKNYVGNLSIENCIDYCENTLKITFLDAKIGSNHIDSSLYLGNYNFATETGNPTNYEVSFIKTTMGSTNTDIIWEFGDGNSLSEFNPVHVYKKPGYYDVCMNANFLSGCTSNLCNSFRFGNVGPQCEANMNIGTPVGTSFNFIGSANLGIEPYSYSWDFGDGNSSIEQNVSYTYANEGVYTVALTVTDANGISDISRQNIRTENSTDCVARYTYNITPLSNPFNLGNVEIEWTDQNGVTYTSKNNAQPMSSWFKVLSVEEYQLNENGQKTKKVSLEFSCILYNGGNQIELKNGTAVIAVAY